MADDNGKKVAIEELKRRVEQLEKKMDVVQVNMSAISVSIENLREMLIKIDEKLDKGNDRCGITTKEFDKRIDKINIDMLSGWKKAMWYIISAVIGGAIGIMFTIIGG